MHQASQSPDSDVEGESRQMDTITSSSAPFLVENLAPSFVLSLRQGHKVLLEPLLNIRKPFFI